MRPPPSWEMVEHWSTTRKKTPFGAPAGPLILIINARKVSLISMLVSRLYIETHQSERLDPQEDVRNVSCEVKDPVENIYIYVCATIVFIAPHTFITLLTLIASYTAVVVRGVADLYP